MLNRESLYKDVVVGVSLRGEVFIIDAPSELIEESLYSDIVIEMTDSPEKWPKEKGVYLCDVSTWYEQGYNEGYKDDGCSEWDIWPESIRKLEVTS